MEKVKFDIREIKVFTLENEEILFTTKTLVDLGLKDRCVKLSYNEKESKPLILKSIALDSLDESLENNIGYVNAHVYARISGNKLDSNKLDIITLGCDPEFFLVNTESKKAVSFGVVTQMKRLMHDYGRDIGIDGAGFIGEFRPAPCNTEEELMENLRGLIKRSYLLVNEAVKTERLKGKTENWRLYGHSYYEDKPSGFHIHLGLPRSTLSNREHLYSLVRALDYFLGIPCLKIDKQYARRVKIPGQRFSGNYGKAYSFKYGNVTLEYRMPGGYHLRHPLLSKSLVGISSLVAEDFIARTKALDKKSVDEVRLYKCPLYSEVKQVFDRIESPKIDEWLSDISGKLRKMVTYNKHKSSIELLLRIAETNPEVSEDIFTNWEAQ